MISAEQKRRITERMTGKAASPGVQRMANVLVLGSIEPEQARARILAAAGKPRKQTAARSRLSPQMAARIEKAFFGIQTSRGVRRTANVLELGSIDAAEARKILEQRERAVKS